MKCFLCQLPFTQCECDLRDCLSDEPFFSPEDEECDEPCEYVDPYGFDFSVPDYEDF